tara:strand:+ start:250 stop:759 length:510 start_codon:yes stop_codon:yes gene_type:complete
LPWDADCKERERRRREKEEREAQEEADRKEADKLLRFTRFQTVRVYMREISYLSNSHVIETENNVYKVEIATRDGKEYMNFYIGDELWFEWPLYDGYQDEKIIDALYGFASKVEDPEKHKKLMDTQKGAMSELLFQLVRDREDKLYERAIRVRNTRERNRNEAYEKRWR